MIKRKNCRFLDLLLGATVGLSIVGSKGYGMMDVDDRESHSGFRKTERRNLSYSKPSRKANASASMAFALTSLGVIEKFWGCRWYIGGYAHYMRICGYHHSNVMRMNEQAFADFVEMALEDKVGEAVFGPLLLRSSDPKEIQSFISLMVNMCCDLQSNINMRIHFLGFWDRNLLEQVEAIL